MRIEIDTGDCDRARTGRAVAELRRIKDAAEHAYYVRVADGRMERSLANERLEAMSTALLLCQSAEDAMALADQMQADRTLFDAIVPALAPKELPYDKGEAVKDAPPVCRLCLHPGEHDVHGSWRCTRVGCLGRTAFTARKIFEGGAA